MIGSTVRSAVVAWTALGAATVSAGCGGGTDVFLARVFDGAEAGIAGADEDAGDASVTDAADVRRVDGSSLDASGGDTNDAPSLGEAGAACPIDGEVPVDTDGLLSQLVGFGRNTTGGRAGCVYHVRSLDDTGPGTLREGAGLTDPAWIVFDVSGDITLASEIRVASDKTIDGRGKNVTLHGYGLGIIGPAHNVIVENLSFASDLTESNNDAIRVIMGAHGVWIDHGSFSGYHDGLIDITRADPSVVTDVTVSWCHFTNHPGEVMLIGRSAADTDDVNMHITVHHNWWDQTGEYAPRLRFGMVHSFNNLIDRWITAAAAVTMNGQLYSEHNIYVADQNKIAINTAAGSDTITGNAASDGDRFDNGAVTEISVPPNVFAPLTEYPYRADPADDTLVANITAGAGAH